MSRTPYQPPRKPNSAGSSNPELPPKPYDFVSFPSERPNLQRPVGHDKYWSDRLHGTLYLTLKVQTSLHISTGIVAMGSDIGSRIPLIKTMVQGVDQKLSIQGSSLKGCIRSVYEAITRSCICKTKANYRQIPEGYGKECKVDIRKDTNKVCDACRIFGALNFQGLLEFHDAVCLKSGFSNGFMPSLHSPRPHCKAYYKAGKIAGRKFYYNMSKSIDEGKDKGISVQQADREYTFTTQLHFKNLHSEELGMLLIVLGQDKENCPIALKMGGGKPIGMGTMTVTIDKIEPLHNLIRRYSFYELSKDNELIGENLKQFIKEKIQEAINSHLLQKDQLKELKAILNYPSNHEPLSQY
ncbi:RAMP superfamily CRISPR-associated protein [Aliinostoc sp. HNIBRCY26]|uniref:RAMP superfamily CRISPR-associated protein n=1 Tax=Aliinostoc sp. HNIBRCY26 TaxID=3418997 RepID=UPI003CFF29F7